MDRKSIEKPGGFMANSTATQNKKNSTETQHKDVLFQKIGNTWFIFSEIKGEVIYSVMPQGMDPRTTKLELFQVIEDHIDRVANHKFNRGSAEAV
jgi:hypothetical protein